MSTASLSYIIFIFIFIFIANKVPKKYFIPVALGFSFFAYGSVHQYNLFFLAAIILLNYGAGLLLAQEKNKKFVLWSSIVLNLIFLFGIKLFFRGEATWLENINASSMVLFGMGSSFYIVQAIGYLCDVYYEKKMVERNILSFSLYISFFPQMVMGPIERSYSLIKQFHQRVNPTTEDIKQNISRIFLGLVKKLVFADNLYIIITPYLHNFEQFDAITNIFTVIFFIMAFYAGFSGYIDIAIGTAGLVGIKLSENFNNPLMAKDLFDFFARWNVTLYNWIKDYVIFPLLKHVSKNKQAISFLVITFLSAIWHQLSWTFVFWGLTATSGFIFDQKVSKIKMNPLLQTILRRSSFYIGGLISCVFFISSNLKSSFTFFRVLIDLSNWTAKPIFLERVELLDLMIITLYPLIIYLDAKYRADLRAFLPKSKLFKYPLYILIIILFFLLKADQSVIFTYNRL